MNVKKRYLKEEKMLSKIKNSELWQAFKKVLFFNFLMILSYAVLYGVMSFSLALIDYSALENQTYIKNSTEFYALGSLLISAFLVFFRLPPVSLTILISSILISLLLETTLSLFLRFEGYIGDAIQIHGSIMAAWLASIIIWKIKKIYSGR